LKGLHLGAEGQDLMALGFQLIRPLFDVPHHSLDDLLFYL
jgi:hypothetical protein